MTFFKRFLSVFLFTGLLAGSAEAQDDLGDALQDVGASYAELYVQPMVDAFGADINSGLFRSASVGAGLIPLVDVSVGVKGFGTILPESAQTLSLAYTRSETFTYDGEEYDVPVTYTIDDAPTVFGETEAGTVTATVDTTIDGQRINEERSFDVLPGLVNTRIAPLLVPQASVGSSLTGTDLTLRYLPEISLGDYGAFNMFGVGVRQEVGRYIPLLPFSVSAQVMYQKMGISGAEDNDIVSATAWAGNVAVSKSLLLLTVYGGLQLERTTVDVEYLFQPQNEDLPGQTIAFDLQGKNNFRALAGLNLSLGLFNVHADYSLGQMNVLTAGVDVVL